MLTADWVSWSLSHEVAGVWFDRVELRVFPKGTHADGSTPEHVERFDMVRRQFDRGSTPFDTRKVGRFDRQFDTGRRTVGRAIDFTSFPAH